MQWLAFSSGTHSGATQPRFLISLGMPSPVVGCSGESKAVAPSGCCSPGGRSQGQNNWLLMLGQCKMYEILGFDSQKTVWWINTL